MVRTAPTSPNSGIGTNEKAIPDRQHPRDEKILGTAHIAFGASAAIGGNVQVPVHPTWFRCDRK